MRKKVIRADGEKGILETGNTFLQSLSFITLNVKEILFANCIKNFWLVMRDQILQTYHTFRAQMMADVTENGINYLEISL